jgi:hypothetical protein
MLGCAAVVCGSTIACAEPLFFKCHGTINTNTQSENDANTQITIDADTGTVEGPGGGTNRYCSRQSDWMTLSQGVQYKIIRECSNLEISEMFYHFQTEAEWRERSPSEVSIKKSGDGHLNMITGEFVAAEQSTGPGSDHYSAWHMTCVPTQR